MDSGNTVLRLINAKIKYNGGEKMNKIFKTNTGLEYKINYDYIKNGNHYYEIEFLITHSKRTVLKQALNQGCIKDLFYPTLYGIGYMGNATSKMNKRACTLWRNMLSRCYNSHNKKDFSSYGGLGVTVCNRWHCFEYFLEDLSKIDGYNEKEFNDGILCLDKDIKQKGLLPSQKVYSLDTCMFISNEINIKYRNTEQYSKHFIAISPDNDLMIIHGIVHFCKIYNFSPGSVKLRLDKKLFKPYHGWNFFSINN